MSGGFLVLLLAMFGFMYFLLIRPQRQQQRKHVDLLSSLKPGDEVVTAGGIYGEVVQLDAERVMLEIDEDVRIAVARRAIASVVPPEELDRLESGEESETIDAEAAEAVTATSLRRPRSGTRPGSSPREGPLSAPLPAHPRHDPGRRRRGRRAVALPLSPPWASISRAASRSSSRRRRRRGGRSRRTISTARSRSCGTASTSSAFPSLSSPARAATISPSSSPASTMPAARPRSSARPPSSSSSTSRAMRFRRPRTRTGRSSARRSSYRSCRASRRRRRRAPPPSGTSTRRTRHDLRARARRRRTFSSSSGASSRKARSSTLCRRARSSSPAPTTRLFARGSACPHPARPTTTSSGTSRPIRRSQSRS